MSDKKSVLLRIISCFIAAVMISGMTACLDGENASADDKNNKNADGTYFDNGETFCRGVWAADDGESRIGYYIFRDAENGEFSDAQYGIGVPFIDKTEKGSTQFSLGAAEFTEPVTVVNTGSGKRELTWTNDNRVEYLTLLTGQEPDSFSYYSRNDLSEMAMEFYEQQTETRPETAGINIDIDGNALIQLFGRDGNQIAEYTVDSITAKGKVNDTQEEIV